MTSLLNIAANSPAEDEVEEGQSLRFNNDDSAYLNWTPPSVGSSLTQTLSFWMKRTTEGNYIFRANEFYLYLSGDNINYYDWRQGANGLILKTNAVYRDPSAWYHVVLTQDRGNATASNRIKLYVNGEQVTSFSTATYPNQNEGSYFNNSGNVHYMGGTSANYYDGYLANVCFIDGTALDPTSFGEYKNTLWKPKDVSGLTFGTNGFFLDFSDSSAIGDDTSGNSNDWTANNLAATDVVLDGAYNGGNFAVMNPLDKYLTNVTLSEGNLQIDTSASNVGVKGTYFVNSGKWYYEARVGNASGVPTYGAATSSWGNTYAGNTGSYGYLTNGYIYVNASAVQSSLPTATTGDIIGIALNMDDNEITFYKNNTQIGTTVTGLASELAPAFSGQASSQSQVNFGQDSSFAGNETPQGNTDGNGVGDFYYAPPSGFLALTTGNLPAATITAPDEYLNTVTYAGNNTQLSVTGVNFQPDLTWIKKRSSAAAHVLQDAVRGTFRYLIPNDTAAENTSSANDWFKSFDSDGFTVSKTSTGAVDTTEWNNSGDTYVAWNWLAGNGTSSNSQGSIASTVSANQTAGFSIVTFTSPATSSTAFTVGHGLSSAPEMIITKERDGTLGWLVYHDELTNPKDNYLLLNSTAGNSGTVTDCWGTSAPTSSVFGMKTTVSVNTSKSTIAYCFHSVDGYSKIGSYTGNSSTDGTFVHCGFRPAWVLIKSTGSGTYWLIMDNARDVDNVVTQKLSPATNAAENDTATMGTDAQNLVDFLSNGFKLKSTDGNTNTSAQTYIFYAVAEAPFKSANAR